MSHRNSARLRERTRWVAAICASLTMLAAGISARQRQTAADAPVGNLQQVMRAILFPNANILFDVQTVDPAAATASVDPNSGTSAKYTNVYGGWERVENAAIALDESVGLILKAGRTCENGKPVPVTSKTYQETSATLRTVARRILAAARAKDRDKVSDLTGDLADACAACHRPYRDIARTNPAARCAP